MCVKNVWTKNFMDCHRTVKQVDTHEVKVKTRFIEEKMSRPLWVFCKSYDFPKRNDWTQD